MHVGVEVDEEENQTILYGGKWGAPLNSFPI